MAEWLTREIRIFLSNYLFHFVGAGSNPAGVDLFLTFYLFVCYSSLHPSDNFFPPLHFRVASFLFRNNKNTHWKYIIVQYRALALWQCKIQHQHVHCYCYKNFNKRKSNQIQFRILTSPHIQLNYSFIFFFKFDSGRDRALLFFFRKKIGILVFPFSTDDEIVMMKSRPPLLLPD